MGFTVLSMDENAAMARKSTRAAARSRAVETVRSLQVERRECLGQALVDLATDLVHEKQRNRELQRQLDALGVAQQGVRG